VQEAVPPSLCCRARRSTNGGLASATDSQPGVLFELSIAPVLGLEPAFRFRPVERLMFAGDHVLYGIVLAGDRGWVQPRRRIGASKGGDVRVRDTMETDLVVQRDEVVAAAARRMLERWVGSPIIDTPLPESLPSGSAEGDRLGQ
jgi:hypothetical protein